MTGASTTAFLRRAGGAAALGCVLGLVDAALHVTSRDWAGDPMLALQGLFRVVGVYGVFAVLASALLGWRALRWVLVGGFTVVQGLAWYYHANPQVDAVPALLALATSAIAAVAVVWFASGLIGRSAPRWGVVGSLLAFTGIVGCAAWLYPAGDSGSLSPSPSALTRTNATAAAAPDTPSVLLFTFDTLRADRLGVYGYTRVRTSNLDALAGAGVLFERAVIQAPLTPASHASLFTGVYPTRHGVRGFTANRLSADHPTLAEVLNRAGYTTAALVAAAPLAPGSGIERGFDSYDYFLRSRDYAFYGFRATLPAKLLKRLQLVPDRTFYRNAEAQTDRAIAWLDGHAGRPFFLWVHYFDVHDPYSPPFRHLQPSAHPGASFVEFFTRSYLYDSELVFLDEQVGRLIDHLRQRGDLQHTIVAGISDHGEGLGEHNYVGHSDRLFDEQTRAPFFLVAPQRIGKGQRVAAQVRGIDLMPTLLDLLALPAPDRVQGTSLLPLIAAPSSAPAPVAFTETFNRPDRRLVSASDGRYKLIVGLDSGSESLFDLAADPAETSNAVTEHTQVAATLRTQIREYLAEAPAHSETSAPLDPAVREQLRALGYLE